MCLESLLRDSGCLALQEAISLEHVLPQKPSPNSYWTQVFPDTKEQQYWTHRLANLVLLARRKNASVQNNDFSEKKKTYFGGKKGRSSPFVLTQELRNEEHWTPQLLATRQNRLVETLQKHWDLL